MTDKQLPLLDRFNVYAARAKSADDLSISGRITRIVGLKLEAIGISAPIGSSCLITTPNGRKFEAEVVGFSEEKLYLMSADNMQGLSSDAIVTPLGKITDVSVGKELLGRVIDGAGNPLDDLGMIHTSTHYSLNGRPINPLSRNTITQPLDVGIRSLNALCTIGLGQRIGLFAGSGVGKSVLLGMMTHFTSADVVIVGLIGERGREIKEFIEHNLGKEGLRRSVVIAAPADTSPLMRLHGAMLATTIAEYFRDQGLKVLLLLDSLTRFAQAQRELALSIGEPPTTKGYAPSVFSKLSQLVERAGNAHDGKGSITGFYTVLTEGDDHNDPIADAARSILDGHIVLSRKLAEMGHYPAIDIEASISRVMTMVVDKNQLDAAQRFKQLYSRYQQNQDLIKIGAYIAGSDPELDKAIKKISHLQQFLQQGISEQVTYQQSMERLVATLDG